MLTRTDCRRLRALLITLLALMMVLLSAAPAEYHAHAEFAKCPDCDTVWDSAGEGCFICCRCADCTEMCGRCDELCIECHATDFAEGVDDTAPCPDCGRCKQDGTSFCHECGRCEDCVELCPRCNVGSEYCLECHEAAAGDGEELPCPNCGYCKADGTEFCTECGTCEECIDICPSCGLCEDCTDSLGVHCAECGNCIEEVGWCEFGGEHCSECCESNGWLCDECGECVEALGKEFCPYCGLCEECCEGLRLDMGCVCDDLCWSELDDDHFCSDCGSCFGSVDICDWCLSAGEYRCEECSELLSRMSGCDCADPVCVNDPGWDAHFSALHAGYSGSHSAKPASAWSMDESFHWHACRYCEDEAHFSDKAAHSFDDDGFCTVCGYSRDEDLFILVQPRDAYGTATYTGWSSFCHLPADDPKENTVTFSVKVYSRNGSDGLSYQWYCNNNAQVDTDTATMYISGSNTPTFTRSVYDRVCSYGNQYLLWCVITDSEGNRVVTDRVELKSRHDFRIVTGPGTGDEGHIAKCAGKDCNSKGELVPHNYGAWEWAEDGSGAQLYKCRICADCDYEQRVYPHEHDCSFGYLWDAMIDDPNDIDVLREDDKEHEYEYGFHRDGKYIIVGLKRNVHYMDCAVEGCDFTLREEHKWGRWHIVNNPNANRPGGAYQECEVCAAQKTWSKTYYELHTHPVNVSDGSCDTDFAGEGATVTITPYKIDGKKPRAAIARIHYDLTRSGQETQYDLTETIRVAPESSGSETVFVFQVPKSGKDPKLNGATRDYKSNPIEVALTYTECSHPESSWETAGEIEAGCETDGYTGDTVCGICGHVMEQGRYVAPTGHGEPVPAEENVYARNSDGDIIYNTRSGYDVPVYIIHAAEDVYCDDIFSRGCYSGDLVCPYCGELLETGHYSPKLHMWVLVDDADPSYKQSLLDEGLRESCEPGPGVRGYTGDQFCIYCGDVRYGRSIPALPVEPDITLGDVNLDGTVDSKDLTALARHVAGIQILNDDRALANSNVNGDDSVDAKDLTKLARFMAHIIDSL